MNTFFLQVKKSDHIKEMAIFQAHGTEDPLVPFRWGEITSKVLASMCANYSFHNYPMAHTSCPEVQIFIFMFNVDKNEAIVMPKHVIHVNFKMFRVVKKKMGGSCVCQLARTSLKLSSKLLHFNRESMKTELMIDLFFLQELADVKKFLETNLP